jgi:raffinose/stachyose/melibiose transport system permease protein
MNPFGKTTWGKSLPYVGLLPAFLLYMVFAIVPSASTVLFSFTDISGVFGTPWKFIGLENYKQLYMTATGTYNELSIDKIIKNTLLFALFVTVLQNVFALVTALLLNAKPKGHLFYRSVIFLPVILGVTVAGLIWSLVFDPLDGPATRILNIFGTSSAFFGDNTWAFPLVIFVQIWINMGFSVLVFLAGLQTIPGDLYEAAEIDGATRAKKFLHVTFPLIAPTVTINILLAIIGSLQTYDTIYVLTKGNFQTMTLGMFVYNTGFGAGSQLGYASAISMILFVIVLVAAMVSQYYLRRRETELL